MSIPSSSYDTGPLPVAEQVSLLPLLEEAVLLGFRLAAYGQPRGSVGGHVQSLLPRATLAAPSVFGAAAAHRTLGLATLRAALETGFDEPRRGEAAEREAAERAHALHNALYAALARAPRPDGAALRR